MSENKTAFDRIRDALNGLVEIHDCDGPLKQPLIWVWSSGAEEQLDALVEEIVRERLEDVAAARKILDGDE